MDSSRPFAVRLPVAISGMGVVLFLVFLSEWLLFNRTGVLLGSEHFLVSLVTAVGFSAGLVYGGYWLDRSDLPPERYSRIGTWFVGGMAFYLAVNLLLMAITSAIPRELLVEWTRFTLSVGSAGGLLLGIVEARAIQRELGAERAAVRAEKAEQQRQYLGYLNSLLRHEVLNTANVVTGYSSVLLENEDFEESTRARLETINRQGEDMTNVIRDVQVLISATRDIADLEPTNLSAVLDRELDELRDGSDAVEIDASVPDDVYVNGDGLLPRVFANLLTNAVEHNERGVPHVEVSVETDAEGAAGENDPETVSVYVADDGPGIPDPERAMLFERGDNTGATHGLGLYLVRTLVERYDGTVELAETGPDGSVFAVELRAADSIDDWPRA